MAKEIPTADKALDDKAIARGNLLGDDAASDADYTLVNAYKNTNTLTDEYIASIRNDLYREGLLYYGKTHRHPNSTFEYTQASLTELMMWDATDNLKLINVPLLMMAGSAADSLYMSEDAI